MKYLAMAAALAALTATPAMADNGSFTGLRAGATAGITDVTGTIDTKDVDYGFDAGIDFPLGENATVGVEAFTTTPFNDEKTFGVAARAGYAVADNALVFARAGYENYENVFEQNLDGLTVGGGLELAISDMTYLRAEYRYSDFENNTGSHGALFGVGLRF